MLHVKSIVFTDEDKQKEISVHLDGGVEASPSMTGEEYCTASLYAGLLLAGGLKTLKEYVQK